MNQHELRTSLPPERQLPAQSRERIKELLMETMRVDETGQRRGAARGGRRRAVALAVLAAAISGGAVAAAGVLRSDSPDPGRAAVIAEGFAKQAAAMHGPGWRPELGAERVTCAPSGAEAATPSKLTIVWASQFPIVERLTADRIVQSCASQAGGGSTPAPAAPTACVPRQGRPLAVVLGDGSSCADAALPLRTITGGDLTELNHLRAVDVAVLGETDVSCPTMAQARTWARDRLREAGEGIHLTDTDEGPGCYRTMIDWFTGTALVQRFGDQPT